MNPGLCFLIGFFLQSSRAAPNPDTHVHVYVPQESGASPNTRGGLLNQGASQRSELETPPIRPPLGSDYQAGPLGKSNMGNPPIGTDYDNGAMEDMDEEDSDEPMNAQKLLDKNTKYPCGQSPIGPGISDDYLPHDDDDGDEISGGRLAEPSVFPWMLRLCYKKENGVGNGETEYHCNCGATLITALHAVTSFHCVRDDEIPCGKPDVSDGKYFVIPGSNMVEYEGSMKSVEKKEHYVVKEVLVPENIGTSSKCENGRKKHSFAMLRFKDRAPMRPEVRPICLPPPGLKDVDAGTRAVAAGWGKQAAAIGTANHWTRRQSRLLKRVTLKVSEDPVSGSDYMFGTKVEFKRGEYQDPCSGDGGGPLMTYNYEDKKQHGRNGRSKWYIIGTLYGGGYDCRTDTVSKNNKDGTWNKAWPWVEWMKEQIKETS